MIISTFDFPTIFSFHFSFYSLELMNLILNEILKTLTVSNIENVINIIKYFIIDWVERCKKFVPKDS